MFEPVCLRRPNHGQDPHGDIKELLATTVDRGLWPVLCTTAWPDQRLTDDWQEWLTAAAGIAAEIDQRPVILADLPVSVFQQLREASFSVADRPVVLRDVIGRRYCERFLDERAGPALRRELNVKGQQWASDLVLNTVVFRSEGKCFELPSGLHSNINVALGHLRRREGGDGLRHYLLGLLARRLLGRHVDGVIYWSGPWHLTFPNLMTELRKLLSLGGRKVRFIQATGEYTGPSVADDDYRWLIELHNQYGTLAVLTDVLATGHLVTELIQQLAADDVVDLHAGSLSLGTIVRLVYGSGGTSVIEVGNQKLRVFSAAQVEAEVSDPRSCFGCAAGNVVEQVDSETRPRLTQVSTDDYQASRATVWSAVLSGGRVGGSPSDHRHLHDRYIQPNPDHVPALMADILPELRPLNIEALVWHVASETAQAIATAIKAVSDRHLPEIGVRKTSDGWSIRRGDISPGSRLAVIDDGLNTGHSMMSALELLRDLGAIPVALIVWEDKLPSWSRTTLRLALEHGIYRPDGGSTLLFSLHRSPPLDPSLLLSGVCRRHREMELAGLLNGRHDLPEAVTEAIKGLESDEVWVSEPSANQGPLLDIDPSVRPGEQANQFFEYYGRVLEPQARVGDIIVQDFLAHFREVGMDEELKTLGPSLLRRAIPWLESREATHAVDALSWDSPEAAVLVALAQLRSARSLRSFSEALGRVALLEAREPVAVADHQDEAVRAVIACLSAAPSLSSWLRNEKLGADLEQGVVTTVLQQVLAALRDDLPSVMDRTTMRRAGWVTVEKRRVEPCPQEFVQAFEDRGWVLDLSSRQLRKQSHVRPLQRDEAMLWAAAMAGGSLITSEATRVYRWHIAAERRRPQHRFETIWRRVQALSMQLPDAPLIAGMTARATPKHRREKSLRPTTSPALLLWDQDRSAFSMFLRLLSESGDSRGISLMFGRQRAPRPQPTTHKKLSAG